MTNAVEQLSLQSESTKVKITVERATSVRSCPSHARSAENQLDRIDMPQVNQFVVTARDPNELVYDVES